MSEFERWLENAEDAAIREELLSIVGNEKEIEDRFYRALSFGTGGLRGILGAGTNRMNRYTVARATLGLADYLTEIDGKSIVIAYDSRNQSRELAQRSANVLSSRGIRVHLFSELTPTPVLSFAVRHLGADAGIVITASHNPKEYNGYKVYNAHGCQITDEAATAITKRIEKHDYFDAFVPNDALIHPVEPSVKEAFLESIQALCMTKLTEKNAPTVVYSPLNGTGRIYVQEILHRIGVRKLFTVREQELPDGNFTTCPRPNPEERETLALALRDAAIHRPDIVMVTDPDADRIGIAVPNRNGEYVLLNGNETGSILLFYLLSKKKESGTLTPDLTAIKTIVTTDIIFDMAREYGIKVKEVLTGFKYIGEALEQTDGYLMGLEESYGYLVGKHARDKDAVSAAMMIAEACAYFQDAGKTLYEVLEGIYAKYGYYQTDLKSISMPGKDGMQEMQALLSRLRTDPPQELDGQPLTFTDFKGGVDGLPPSDVLRFQSPGHRIIVRPSGTEPKMKVYLQAKGATRADAQESIARQISMLKKYLPL